MTKYSLNYIQAQDLVGLSITMRLEGKDVEFTWKVKDLPKVYLASTYKTIWIAYNDCPQIFRDFDKANTRDIPAIIKVRPADFVSTSNSPENSWDTDLVFVGDTIIYLEEIYFNYGVGAVVPSHEYELNIGSRF